MNEGDVFINGSMNAKKHPEFSIEVFSQMFAKLGRLWWSRLVIACRGYAVSDFKGSDSIVFSFDDAFIYVHQRLVEGGYDMALQLMQDIQLLEDIGSDTLKKLFDGQSVPSNENPFNMPNTRNSFRRIFGEPSPLTDKTALMRGFCYLVFLHILTKYQRKWIFYTSGSLNGDNSNGKLHGTTELEPFQDPDWRPDERVVIFRSLSPRQRAWVLTDFDRYVIKYWRPNGVRVIFGYEYVASKLQEGLKLCSYCGLLESQPGSFKRCLVCQKQESKDPACYCSEDCEDLFHSKHVKEHQAKPKVTFNI